MGLLPLLVLRPMGLLFLLALKFTLPRFAGLATELGQPEGVWGHVNYIII